MLSPLTQPDVFLYLPTMRLGILPFLVLVLAFGVRRVVCDDAFRAHAIELMESSPLIDGHVDLPFIVRSLGTSSLSLSPLCHGRRTPNPTSQA